MKIENISKLASGLASAVGSSLAALPRRFFTYLHRVAGIDRRILARCSKTEQAVYTALALTMVLAAAATGIGIAAKLQALFAAGWFLTILIALAVAIFSLCLEIAVVGSIKAGSNIMLALGLRAPLALILSVIQVIPLWLAIYGGQIAVESYRQQLSTQIDLRAASAKAVDLDAVRLQAAQLAKVLDTAKQNQSNPAPSPPVLVAGAELKKAEQGLGGAILKFNTAKQQFAAAKEAQAKALDDKTKAQAAAKLEVRSTALAKAQQALNGAAAARDNAESALVDAQAAQRRELAESVAAAEQAAAAHGQIEKATAEAMAANVDKASELSKAGNSGNFMAQLTTLLSLWHSDRKIMLVSLGILAVALLIDLLPTGIKLSLKSGPYGKAVAAMEARALERTAAQSEVDTLNLENQLAQERDVAMGVKQYFATNGGALEAQRLAIEQQAEVDKAQLLAPFLLTKSAFEAGICQVLEAAAKAEEMVQAHPQLKPVFAEQLRQLLARLEAQAQTLAQNQGGAHTAGPAAA